MKITNYADDYNINLSGGNGVATYNSEHNSLGSNTPLVESGSGAPGSGPQASAWDHVHPALAGGTSFGSNSNSVSSANAAGASSSNSHADHVHRGVATLAKSGSTGLVGDVTLTAGSNVTLTQAGNDISIASTGGGGGTLASAAYKRSTGDYTSTSSTFVDLDSTNMSLTITTGAHRVLIGFTGTAEHTGGTSDNVIMDFTVDGTRQGGTLGLMSARPGSNIIRVNCSFTFLTDVLSAGSHTFKVQWRRLSAGTMTMHADSTDTEAQFYVMEQGG